MECGLNVHQCRSGIDGSYNGVDEINHQLFNGYFTCSVFYLYKNHLFGIYLKNYGLEGGVNSYMFPFFR
jgi:hypothetical protein